MDVHTECVLTSSYDPSLLPCTRGCRKYNFSFSFVNEWISKSTTYQVKKKKHPDFPKATVKLPVLSKQTKMIKKQKQTANHHTWVAWTSKFDDVCLVNNLQINNEHLISQIHSFIPHNCQAPLLCYYSCIKARHECKHTRCVFWNSSVPRDKTKPIYSTSATMAVKTMT